MVSESPLGSYDLRALLRVPPDADRFDLAGIDPRSTPGLPRTSDASDRPGGRPKRWAAEDLVAVGRALTGYQERLYAAAKRGADRRRVLLVLQAMDCGGKDGTVSHVVGLLNPLGIRITSFGVPTPQERRHHFLWRIGRAVPAPGYLGVFNRSHYEDVLVTRVHGLVPPRVWRQRYERINAFERRLADDGVTLLKIMLHISPEEQRARLLERLDDPEKHWKFEPGDIDERAHWEEYQAAYRDALVRCSTGRAPWYVVPADRKWYRNWAVARLLLHTFAALDPRYPPAGFDVDEQRRRLADQ